MMPLQGFEKHPEADAYRVGGFYSPYCLVSTNKRFSDAELAAEWWAACLDYDDSRAATLRRFAALPHFDA